MPFIDRNDTILFQGDSITDCDRLTAGNGLGSGYPLIAAGLLTGAYPNHSLTVLNRGISGNRTADLVNRWGADCIDLKPDVVSIMIGINDTWRAMDSNDPTGAADYEGNYRTLLTRIRDESSARIVLLEPFLLPVYAHPAKTREEYAAWRADLDPKIHAVRALAVEFGAAYVPLDGLFAAACVRKPAAYWAYDGIHPTDEGHGFIAKAWLDAVVPA